MNDILKGNGGSLHLTLISAVFSFAVGILVTVFLPNIAIIVILTVLLVALCILLIK